MAISESFLIYSFFLYVRGCRVEFAKTIAERVLVKVNRNTGLLGIEFSQRNTVEMNSIVDGTWQPNIGEAEPFQEDRQCN